MKCPLRFLLLLLLLPSCVTMGKYHALVDRVAELENTVERSQAKVTTLETRIEHFKGLTDKEAAEIRTHVADMAADYSELQMTLGSIQGRQEEVEFKLNAIARHLKGLKGLVEDRFGVDADALPEELPEEPDAFYQLGMSHYEKGLLRKSRAIFKAFIQRFPEHEMADDAQYMIGETLLSEQRYTEAVNAYKTVYDQYQAGDRYQDAVLRIGLAYVRSNKCSKALKIYKFAARTFKGTPTAEAANKEIKELKKVCK